MKIDHISKDWAKRSANGSSRWVREIFSLSVPLLVGSCSLLVTLWLWQILYKQERTQTEEKVNLAAQTVKNEVQTRLEVGILGLKEMTKRWENEGRPTRKEWKAASQAYLDFYPSCQILQWIDSSLRPRWTVSQTEIEPPDGKLHQQLLAAYKQKGDKLIIVPSTQRKKELWIYIPFAQQGRETSFLFAVYRTEDLLKTILNEEIAPEYGLSIFDLNGEIFSRNKAEEYNSVQWGKEISFSQNSINFRVKIWPTYQLLEAQETYLAEYILGMGFVVAISLSFAVHNAQKSKQQAEKIELANWALNQQISDREKTEANLRQYMQMIDLANDAIIILDLDDVIVYWNRGAERLYGWRKEEVINKYIHRFLKTTSSLPWDEIKAACLHGGYWQGELIHTKRDGSQITVGSRWTLQQDEKGKAAAFLEINHDITDRKRTEEILHQSEWQLREQAAQLEEAFQELKNTQSQLIQSEKMSSLGQLVAGVAHEINNPVNFIYGNITHAKEYTEDLLRLIKLYAQEYPIPTENIIEEMEAIDLDFLIVDLPKLLVSMKVGAERIREIVKSLRHFSRLDEAEKKEVDIHEGIDSTLMILQNRLKAKPDHPAIEVIKEYGKLPLVECYAGQLNQVFMNLLTNAIDALEEYNKTRSLAEIQANPSLIKIKTEMGDPNSTITPEKAKLSLANPVYSSESYQSVKIRISDNGYGMTEEVRQRLFDPFFTTKPIGKGTGLGLSISYQIVVEKHKGKLECYSQLGKGAELVIEIPLRQLN